MPPISVPVPESCYWYSLVPPPCAQSPRTCLGSSTRSLRLRRVLPEGFEPKRGSPSRAHRSPRSSHPVSRWSRYVSATVSDVGGLQARDLWVRAASGRATERASDTALGHPQAPRRSISRAAVATACQLPRDANRARRGAAGRHAAAIPWHGAGVLSHLHSGKWARRRQLRPFFSVFTMEMQRTAKHVELRAGPASGGKTRKNEIEHALGGGAHRWGGAFRTSHIKISSKSAEIVRIYRKMSDGLAGSRPQCGLIHY